MESARKRVEVPNAARSRDPLDGLPSRVAAGKGWEPGGVGAVRGRGFEQTGVVVLREDHRGKRRGANVVPEDLHGVEAWAERARRLEVDPFRVDGCDPVARSAGHEDAGSHDHTNVEPPLDAAECGVALTDRGDRRVERGTSPSVGMRSPSRALSPSGSGPR